MKDRISELESLVRKLEPSSRERNDYIRLVFDYSQTFLNSLEDRNAFNQSETNGNGLYEYPISEEPGSIESILSLFDNHVAKPGLNPASGKHFGYIPGGGLFPAALGDYLADVTNRYAGIYFASPGAVRMENMMIRWMCDMVGYSPKTSGGNLTSGGSIANLTALVAARDNSGISAKDYENAVIYATEHVHHCIDKAIHIAGMQDSRFRHVSMDDHYRMNTAVLEEMILEDKKKGLRPFIIIASCGTTDLGAVDPISEIGEIAQKYNIWFHIDAAYGGFFILGEEGEKVISGLDKADSVVVDPHKGLFLPYGTGAVLVKDKETLFNAMHYTAHYMQDAFEVDEELSPADLSPELSKHFRGARMWLPLKLFGLAPFRAALDEKILLARYFYEKINRMEGFETGPYPDLSIVAFRYIPQKGNPDDYNQKLIQEIQKDGRVFFSSTRISGIFYIRLAVVSFRTHLKEIELALNVLRELTDQLG